MNHDVARLSVATPHSPTPEPLSALTPGEARTTHTDVISHVRRWAAWDRFAIIGVVLLSVVLNFLHLDREGYANTYYAAAVKSMLQSWHNFFFVSFDPGGFVAVDKPPLGLWLQTVSAKLFGFNGVSMLLPQAAAGVLSVIVLYILVARIFGRPAGILAALVLAVTPIAVVDSRNNTSDSVLILALLLAALVVFRAIETGRLRWLLLGGVLIGLGFNVKEMEAYLVLPALIAVYLGASQHRWLTRAWHVILGLVVTAIVSFSWIFAVDLTPASQRPYVSDSGTNSELSLALGYNGFGRLAMGIMSHLPSLPLVHVRIDWSIVPAISLEIGNPSIFRLLQSAIGAQASWMILTALLGLVVAAMRTRFGFPLSWEHLALIFWGVWLVTLAVFFSVARFYHLYYLAILAPVVAALAGIGLISLWQDFREAMQPGSHWWQGWMLPITVPVTAFAQGHLLDGYSTWNPWLGPVIEMVAVLVAVALVAALIAGRLGVRFALSPQLTLRMDYRAALPVLTLGIAALLAAPTAFAADAIANNNGAAWLPQAGPSLGFGFGGPRGGSPGGRFGGPGSTAPNFGTGALRSGTSRGSSGRPAGFGGGPPGIGPPQAGFGRGFRAGGFGGGGGALTFAGTQIPTLDPKLLAYLKHNRGTAQYLVATPASSYASLFILATDQPVMTLGGYQGWDKILTVAQLRADVKKGIIRFFLVSDTGSRSFGGGPGGFTGNRGPGGLSTRVDSQLSTVNNGIFAWVKKQCAAVPMSAYTTAWKTTATGASSIQGARFGGPQSQGPGVLYDCSGAAKT